MASAATKIHLTREKTEAPECHTWLQVPELRGPEFASNILSGFHPPGSWVLSSLHDLPSISPLCATTKLPTFKNHCGLRSMTKNLANMQSSAQAAGCVCAGISGQGGDPGAFSMVHTARISG